MKKTTLMIMITALLVITGCSGSKESTEIKVHLSDTDYLHLKYPMWFEENEGLDKGEISEEMKLGFIEEMLVDKEEAIAILGKRIEAAAEPVTGLAGMLNKLQLTVVAMDEPDTWIFTINRKVDSERITRLLEAKVDLGFWETYELEEIWDYLAQANFLLRETNVMDELMLGPDTTEYGNMNPIFRFLYPWVDNEGNIKGGSTVGYANVKDTGIVNRIFALQAVSNLFPRNLMLLWSSKPEMGTEDFYTLIALKVMTNREPLLTDENIVGASVNAKSYLPSIDMTMNTEGASLWSRITTDNLDREIAVTVNGAVLMHPRVTSVITSGSTSITGNFTGEEIRDLAIILDSGKMPPLGVKVLGIK